MRRTRFTVYFESGEPRVCLCYTAEFAADYYERRGLTVAKVVKEDYRKKLSTSGPTRIKFAIDQKAVNEACDLLGVKLRVKVRTHARRGNTNGNHSFRDECWHDVMVKSYLTAEQATETLWHELTHAMQAERAIAAGKRWSVVSKEQRRYAYRIRPIEIEAREMATAMKDIPLCKPNR